MTTWSHADILTVLVGFIAYFVCLHENKDFHFVLVACNGWVRAHSLACLPDFVDDSLVYTRLKQYDSIVSETYEK